MRQIANESLSSMRGVRSRSIGLATWHVQKSMSNGGSRFFCVARGGCFVSSSLSALEPPVLDDETPIQGGGGRARRRVTAHTKPSHEDSSVAESEFVCKQLSIVFGSPDASRTVREPPSCAIDHQLKKSAQMSFLLGEAVR